MNWHDLKINGFKCVAISTAHTLQITRNAKIRPIWPAALLIVALDRGQLWSNNKQVDSFFQNGLQEQESHQHYQSH